MVPWETRLFSFPESPDVSRGEVVGKKNLLFPTGPYIKCVWFPKGGLKFLYDFSVLSSSQINSMNLKAIFAVMNTI